jgi:hypothetical protein
MDGGDVRVTAKVDTFTFTTCLDQILNNTDEPSLTSWRASVPGHVRTWW